MSAVPWNPPVMQPQQGHPLEKVIRNLERCNKNGPKIVLLSTGSFCPVHNEHVAMFEVARAFLEENHHCDVVGGFLSPSHDRYVHGKLMHELIPASHRMKMCELATADSPWIGASPWEASQGAFMSFEFVASNLQQDLDGLVDNWQEVSEVPIDDMQDILEDVRVYILCGADLSERCRLYTGIGSVGVVVVGRPDTGNRERLAEATLALGSSLPSADAFIFVPSTMDDVSSTKIRKCLADGAPVDELTPPPVAQYLEKNDVFCRGRCDRCKEWAGM